jgi:hypothetical protein
MIHLSLPNHERTFSSMIAGSTLPMVPEGVDLDSNPTEHAWSAPHHSTFHLRSGQNYSKNQEKSPSPPSLMELVGVDFVRCQSRIDHITSHLSIPPEWMSRDSHHPDMPSLFVVNTQVTFFPDNSLSEHEKLPDDFSPSFFHSPENGSGWSLTFYFKMTEVSSIQYVRVGCNNHHSLLQQSLKISLAEAMA